MFQVCSPQLVSMQTRDGVRLDADVYYPDIDGTFPVLLMRQPYGRAIASTVVYAHPAWYAAHGYIVVIQDVRGRGSSAGEFRLFETEIADGADTIDWAANLPGSDGHVGMYGFSYQGMTQLYAAAAQPSALKTICPAMIGYDLYADWAYEGGAFCWQTNLAWAVQLAAETARRSGDESTFLKLAAAAKSLPLADAVPVDADLLRSLAADSFYHDWLNRPADDDYWQRLSPKTYAAVLADLPMLHIGGWFDTFARGTLNLYQAMAAASPHPQHLIMGPWTHLPWGRRAGDLDFGTAAVNPCDRLQVQWFDYWLKGIANGVADAPAVRLFEMGSQDWLVSETWPLATPQQFYLHPTGLTSMTCGVLSPDLPAAIVPQSDRLVHDPWRPVPAVGGHATYPAGPIERSSVDDRSDVLTYTTEPLIERLQIVGAAELALYCAADAASWDICVVLSDVHPNGRAYSFAQGYQRVNQTDALPLVVKLQPTCIVLPKGHCLRVSLSAASFPAYPVNPGNGDRPETAQRIAQQIITLSINGTAITPSSLVFTGDLAAG
ncbi:CocE/NonD family hydrolase [filamentous cyanobacterium LEGE 11480]|uniref:CocE/NonD family hydrolase n=1 Tax=Romeriopsis navalis LEGE 11480 TaxID=2777977 RepID=A0A928VV90_9CYAN|nr:CocE/NonD family hydrolase [Romeriopsis navalis]MBE9032849.1 CocE/NonD family hydrolase [Romeriopsis navalis LEGE 11480]